MTTTHKHDQTMRNSLRLFGVRAVRVGNPAGRSPSGEPLWHTSAGRAAQCLLRPATNIPAEHG